MGPGDLTEQPGEFVLARIGGVVLVAQEHHPVPQQRGAQLADGAGIDLAAYLDAADDRSDDAAYLRYLDVPERRVRRPRHILP